MSFIQKTFPEDILKSAIKIKEKYFLEHDIQIDYFKKGYEAIPTLFKFSFDKKEYEKLFLSAQENITKLEELISDNEDSINEVSIDKTLNKSEKDAIISDTLKVIETIKDKISLLKEFINLKESDFTKFDINRSMEDLYATISHEDEKLSKPINALIYKFFDFEKELTDYKHIRSKRTISDFIKTLMAAGFTYDKDNCIFGKIIENSGIKFEQITEDKIKTLEIIDDISNFVTGNNHGEYIVYVEENNIDTSEIFNDKSLLAYSIAMDKKHFAKECIFEKKEVTLNKDNKMNDVISQVIYSIIYRNHKIDDYLSVIVDKIDFSNKDQEYINEFVRNTFIEYKKKLSKEIFNLYKDKIDNKKLSIALVKDSNVYRLEESTISKYIKEAFEKYPEDLMQVENILTHFNYYKKTMAMIENLKNTPDILINGENVSHYILNLKNETQVKIESIEKSGEVKHDYWEDSEELLTETEYLTEKLDKINEYLNVFPV